MIKSLFSNSANISESSDFELLFSIPSNSSSLSGIEANTISINDSISNQTIINKNPKYMKPLPPFTEMASNLPLNQTLNTNSNLSSTFQINPKNNQAFSCHPSPFTFQSTNSNLPQNSSQSNINQISSISENNPLQINAQTNKTHPESFQASSIIQGMNPYAPNRIITLGSPQTISQTNDPSATHSFEKAILQMTTSPYKTNAVQSVNSILPQTAFNTNFTNQAPTCNSTTFQKTSFSQSIFSIPKFDLNSNQSFQFDSNSIPPLKIKKAKPSNQSSYLQKVLNQNQSQSSLTEDNFSLNNDQMKKDFTLEYVDHRIYFNSIETIKNHGIGAAHLFLSDFEQEIGKSLIALAYQRLINGNPNKFQKVTAYINSFIPNVLEQIARTPCKEFKDEHFLSSLFKGEEFHILKKAFFNDSLYKAALYLSHEKLPFNFQFAPEMHTPNGWTQLHDFIAIISIIFLNDRSDVIYNKQLPYMTTINSEDTKWIKERIMLIYKEIIPIIPKSFNIYENANGKLKPKEIGNIEDFIKINSYVVYPRKLSINFQKKILRLLFLYGIPKNDGIEKIENILGYKNAEYKPIHIFIIKVLNKCVKYEPDLVELMRTLPSVKNEYFNDIENVDIRWINEEAIKSISSNIMMLYKVRENYSFFSKQKNIIIDEWKEIKGQFNFWKTEYEKVLFKMTAYYGFLFNSLFLFFIKGKEVVEYETIIKLREEEIKTLTPITNHEKLNFLGPILNFEYKKNRIEEILRTIDNKKQLLNVFE